MRTTRTRGSRTAALWLLVMVAMVANIAYASMTSAQSGADDPNTCKDLAGYTENLEGDSAGVWGSATFTQDDGPLVLDVNDGYTVWLCVKKASDNNEYGPVEVGPFVGPLTDVLVNYPGDFDPADGFSHYAVRYESTTTTTGEVTTTTEEVTTTTEEVTTTTEDTSTTDQPAETTTTMAEEVTTTTAEEVTSTTAEVGGLVVTPPEEPAAPEAESTGGVEVLGAVEARDQLPRTGVETVLAVWGAATLALGVLLWTLSRRTVQSS